MSESLKFLRYAGVGIGATAAHYGVLVAGVEYAGVAPALAAAAGAFTGAVISYGCNRHYTFSSTALHRQSLPRFVLVALGSIGLSALIVAGGASMGAPYIASQLVATALVLFIGFAIHRGWTFS